LQTRREEDERAAAGLPLATRGESKAALTTSDASLVPGTETDVFPFDNRAYSGI